MTTSSTPRQRIEVAKGDTKWIAHRCNCTENYVAQVLAGKCNQNRTDLQRNIVRVAERLNKGRRK